MPIRHLITSDNIQNYEASATGKYESGFNLLVSQDFGTGVYLMGLAAEMLLKAAYFRFIGFSLIQPITWNELQQAKLSANHLGVMAQPEQYHNLMFWAELIVETRNSSARSLSPILSSQLLSNMQVLTDNWSIAMRYQSLQGAHISDLNSVFDTVSWLMEHQEDLWS